MEAAEGLRSIPANISKPSLLLACISGCEGAERVVRENGSQQQRADNDRADIGDEVQCEGKEAP